MVLVGVPKRAEILSKCVGLQLVNVCYLFALKNAPE